MINKSMEAWLNEDDIRLGHNNEYVIFDTQQCIDRCEIFHSIDKDTVLKVLDEAVSVFKLENVD